MGKNGEEKRDETKKGILWHHSSTSLNFFICSYPGLH